MSREVLDAANVWKRYYERGPWILSGLYLKLGAGEKAAVIGGNGTGKTTLLRIIAGLVPPSKGEIRIMGLPPSDPRARMLVGIVLHSTLTYDELTVRENLNYYASLYNIRDYDAEEDETVERLGLKNRLDQRAGELSFGWRKRANIARALLHRPALLAIDEPFTGLDDDAVETLRGLREKVGLVVLSGTNENATVPWAHWVLPSAAYVEKDGTFVNCDGRVQRIGRAFPPLADSREDWRVLLELAAALGHPFGWKKPAEIFQGLAEVLEPFNGLTYETIGPQGVHVATTEPAPGASVP